MLDEEGNVVKLADNNITCHIDGDASLLGLENSDNADMGDYRDNCQRVFKGRLLAYVRNGENGGKVKLTFTSPLLQDAVIEY